MDIRDGYGVSMRGTVVGVGATDSIQPGTVLPARELIMLCNLMECVPESQEWEG